MKESFLILCGGITGALLFNSCEAVGAAETAGGVALAVAGVWLVHRLFAKVVDRAAGIIL